METSTVLYIALALIVALGFAFFQYLFRKNKRSTKDYIFFTFRALVVFLVLLLLINPKITSTEYEIQKPELVILSDNSQSVSHLDQEERLIDISNTLAENKKIRENFRITRLNFGEELNIRDSLDFLDTQTNLYSALYETENLLIGKQSVVVLITDGNQNLGRDFRYYKNNEETSVFPIIIGDTTTYKDLSIERINSNRYAFLNNRFPVEVFLNYKGEENISANIKVKSGDAVLYTQKIEFTKDIKSQILRTDLPANSIGVKSYSIEIDPIEDEKNILNNKQHFAVEVIDERTEVLILSEISHPDLGALKKSIESNEQRSVDVKYLNEINYQISDYQLIILYQITNNFNDIVGDIIENNYNYLIITGSKTDWNYLNNLDFGYSKNFTNQPQEVFPVYNSTFSSFQFEDIGFGDYPPLIDKFGSLKFDQNSFNVMLSQELHGVNTGKPLMGVTQSTPKSGFLFGENIWRWRAKAYLDTNSFQEFDDFMGKLIQNLASKKSRQRLTVEADNFYYANQDVIITAQYFDENYQFDPGEDLKVTVENNKTEEKFTSDLILKNSFYQFDGGDLSPGEYSYILRVQGKNLSKSGSFEVIEYNTEQQFVSSNLSGMLSFAKNSETVLYYPDKFQELVNTLLTNDKFKPTQKSRQKNVPLIDWYYLLFILIIILAAEWFYRKYLGLI